MKAKSIKTVEVKEIGAINLNNIEAVNGNLLVHIPISHANEGLEDLVNKLYKDFLEKHPDVDEEEICVDVNVQYTFGGWITGINSDFILDIYLWQESNEDVVEDYDDIPLYLGEEGTRTVVGKYLYAWKFTMKIRKRITCLEQYISKLTLLMMLH